MGINKVEKVGKVHQGKILTILFHHDPIGWSVYSRKIKIKLIIALSNNRKNFNVNSINITSPIFYG